MSLPDFVNPHSYTIYRGKPTNRGLSDVEALWKQENLPVLPLRTIIFRALDAKLAKAHAEYKKQLSFTVLDFGCGEKGQVLTDLLQSSSFQHLTHIAAVKYPEINVDFTLIGITAAKTGEEKTDKQISVEPKASTTAQKLPNLHVSASIHSYSVSQEQPLANFLLENLGSEEGVIDVGFASSSLTYLVPKVFEKCLQDISKALATGGTFIGYELASAPGVYMSPVTRRGHNGLQTALSPYTMPTILNDFATSVIQGELKDSTSSLLPYAKRIAKLRSILNQTVSDQLREDLKKIKPTDFSDPKFTKIPEMLAIHLAIEMSEYQEIIRKILAAHMQQQKHKILITLSQAKETKGMQLAFSKDMDGFVMEKRVTG